MESVQRKAGVHCSGTIFPKCPVQLPAYADVIGCTKRDATAALSATEYKSTKMGLAVNEGKTKYMLSTSRDVRCIDSQITADNYTFFVQSMNLYMLASLFPPKMMPVRRSNAGSFLPTSTTMV